MMQTTQDQKTEQAAKIVERVAAEFGVTTDALQSADRREAFTLPRHTALALMVSSAGFKWREAGAALGRKTHAVDHALHAIRDRYETDRRFAERYERLRRELTAEGLLP